MTKTKITLSPDLTDELQLGKNVSYIEHYDPSLLQGVPRSLSRKQIGINEPLPFQGIDIWNGYELSWLNTKGKPCVAILQCKVPINSEFLIESKSFKLYLNSFNQTKFETSDDVLNCLITDLSKCANATVEVNLILSSQFNQLEIYELAGELIDEQVIEVTTYSPNSSLLTFDASTQIEETLTSNLLKSNCLITNQPDWASIQIYYQGCKIDREGLLAYLISFRQHNEFHEQCVERIYSDLMEKCKPNRLSVYARYTRRGGLDINPFRSNFSAVPNNKRNARQ